jgi:hypothetical protein
MAEAVEYWPRKCKVLSSVLSTAKEIKKEKDHHSPKSLLVILDPLGKVRNCPTWEGLEQGGGV